MPRESNNPKGRTPDDPNGARVSMHIRMQPSVKAKLENLSDTTGRTMIEILETGVRIQEPQTEFKITRGGLTLPSHSEVERWNANTPHLKHKKTGRVNRGNPTNDLILTCYQDGNDFVFARIIDLYVPRGSRIADCTYGKGVFWKRVNRSQFECLFSDLKRDGLPAGVKGGIDSRCLPYEDAELDALVFDPPYMHTPGGTAHNGHQNFEQYYANNVETESYVAVGILDECNGPAPKYHEAVLDLYYRSAREAWRVLRPGGIYIVKCQDEVCTNRNRFTHVEIMNELTGYGFICEDLFVVMRTNKPGVSRIKTSQVHARKNHSYFLVFQKARSKSDVIYESARNSRKKRPNGIT